MVGGNEGEPPHSSSRSTVDLSCLLAGENDPRPEQILVGTSAEFLKEAMIVPAVRRFSHCNGTKVEQNIVLSWIYLWQRLDALSSHLDNGLRGAGGWGAHVFHDESCRGQIGIFPSLLTKLHSTIEDDIRMRGTRESIGLIRWHGQHVLGDVDAQLLVQNHLVKLLIVFGVVHQHLNFLKTKNPTNKCEKFTCIHYFLLSLTE